MFMFIIFLFNRKLYSEYSERKSYIIMHLHPEQDRSLIDHNEEHVKSSDFIKDIVIGMSDGLTVPFALAAGLSGAVSSTSLVITAGIAEIAAGSIAMGLGGYLAGETEVDQYNHLLENEYKAIENNPEEEILAPTLTRSLGEDFLLQA